jgi:PEP-CTERM motif
MNLKKTLARTLTQMVAGGAMLIASSLAVSAPVLWTLSNVTFDDGGIATGSFTFDADTNAYSSVLITTSGGSVLPGSTYDTGEIVNTPFTTNSLHLTLIDGFGAADLTGNNLIGLTYASALTNAGGSINLVAGYFNTFEGICGTPDCLSGTGNRTLRAGSIVASALPEPGSIALVGLGLGLAGWAGRRRAA